MTKTAFGNSATALVTGANKGIGKEIARLLAEAGLTVYASARRRAAETEISGDVRFVHLDVTDPDSIAAAAEEVGDLDILVNNAGIMVGGGNPAEAAIEDFRRTYETNVFGVLAVTNAFLPALRRSPRPRIVNVSSGTGSLTRSAEEPFAATNGSGAAYRSSKTALNAITLFYAQALPAFRINALAPGLRRTDLNERARSAEGDPAEAAAAAVRLALLDDDGPTGGFFSWDGSPMPW